MSLPTGTVTFLFTDIEASTRLVQDFGDTVSNRILADHRRLLLEAVESIGGSVYQDQGESFVLVFPSAKNAVLGAVAAQRALQEHAWPNGGHLRVRMGLHTGEPVGDGGQYVGVDIHRAARICGAGHGGQILLSQTTYDLVVDDFPDGVGMRDLGEHRLKDLARPLHLYQVVAADLPTDFPALKYLDVLPNNLPIQLTSFVGREWEIAEVKRLLSGTRLLTLTGIGGVGKTRLALQVAAQVLDEFQDGVWLVELAPLSDPALITQTVASALGLREQSGRPIMATLTDVLRSKHLLLVIDNAEHVVTACAHLADSLLRVCPSLRILATSRERLAIAGETVWPVSSLSLPDPQRLPFTDLLTEYEAVRLFIERAKAAHPAFKLTDQSALTVARICQQLDGLPLAIELAAARVRVLSVQEIATRLDDRFLLLRGGGRTAPPRHQTLQAAVDWSHDLLPEKDRILFRRLSVFAGGWTLEAAETVCSGDGIEAREVLGLLTQLVDKSLVAPDPVNGKTRYGLLRTISQYSREKLDDAGEVMRVRTRHGDWFLSLAEQAEPELDGPEQVAWLNQLDAEHANCRAALQWSLAEGEAESTLRLAVALGYFWYVRGHLSEGRKWLEGALLASGSVSSSVRAKALSAAGALARNQGDYRPARSFYEESLAISHELRDRRSIANSLRALGWIAKDQGEYAVARSLYQESLAIARELEDRQSVADTLRHLGLWSQDQGDYVAARSLHGEAVQIFREMGNKWKTGWSLDALGWIGQNQGDYASARSFHEESLKIFREMETKRSIGWALYAMGNLSYLQGDRDQAKALSDQALALLTEVGDRVGIAYSQNNLALLAVSQGDWEEAKTLSTASLAIFRELGEKEGIGTALHSLGNVARLQEDYSASWPLLEESLTIFREIGHKEGTGWVLNALAKVTRLQGSYDHAAVLHREALTLMKQIGEKRGIVANLAGLAGVACVRGDPGRAARLLGAAEVLRAAIGTVLNTADHADYERNLADVRAVLGQEAFGAAWSEGRAMTTEQAIEYALSDET